METIVNRVQMTPHLANEIEKIQKTTIYNPAGESPAQEETAEKEAVKELVKSLPLLQEAIDSGLGNSIIARGEFEQFKKEVIAAFKHLGLDTKKHFS